jgi:excisionase family DNA binding protein
MKKVMTVKEVAKLLRVHQATIYRLLRAKRFPGFRLGYDWRFRLEAVEAWMKENSSLDRS